ncbi:hypothetical protein RLOC_00012969 [Lonchura striata]|uniref:Uncharacterized protein n=1 Tax=Lonchura striata TaxID=40157 RepID=A0A218V2S2_9PASE|nr:hypothetical protein RLOC_00012969 [Lonchura striata domestica]
MAFSFLRICLCVGGGIWQEAADPVELRIGYWQPPFPPGSGAHLPGSFPCCLRRVPQVSAAASPRHWDPRGRCRSRGDSPAGAALWYHLLAKTSSLCLWNGSAVVRKKLTGALFFSDEWRLIAILWSCPIIQGLKRILIIETSKEQT